jgi:hypothetical protein
MSRLALIVALLAFTACGQMSPDQADRMAALGRSMQYQGNVWAAQSQPRYVYPAYPAYSPGTVRYCGTDGLGQPHFCY